MFQHLEGLFIKKKKKKREKKRERIRRGDRTRENEKVAHICSFYLEILKNIIVERGVYVSPLTWFSSMLMLGFDDQPPNYFLEVSWKDTCEYV